MTNNEEDWLESEPEQPPSSTFWFEPQPISRPNQYRLLPGEGGYYEILLDALDRELNQYRQHHPDVGEASELWFMLLDELDGQPLDNQARTQLGELSTVYSPEAVSALSAKVTLFENVKIEVTDLTTSPVQANWRTLTVRKLDS